jgi:hypothetical protein
VWSQRAQCPYVTIIRLYEQKLVELSTKELNNMEYELITLGEVKFLFCTRDGEKFLTEWDGTLYHIDCLAECGEDDTCHSLEDDTSLEQATQIAETLLAV